MLHLPLWCNLHCLLMSVPTPALSSCQLAGYQKAFTISPYICRASPFLLMPIAFTRTSCCLFVAILQHPHTGDWSPYEVVILSFLLHLPSSRVAPSHAYYYSLRRYLPLLAGLRRPVGACKYKVWCIVPPWHLEC